MNVRVGIFFVLGIALLWVTFQALHNGSFQAKDGYQVGAAFKTLRELKVGNEVRMAGVPIGVVSDLRLSAGRAEAVLTIRKDVTIARDATATIAMAGLIGANYVSLDLGTSEAGVLAPGEKIHTRDVPDFNQIMSDLGDLGGDIKTAVNKIGAAFGDNPDGTPGLINNLNGLVTENRASLASTITNLNEITAKIRSGDGTLAKLINDPAAYDQLLAAVTEIKNAATDAKGFIGETQTIVTDIKSGRGTIGALIYDETTSSNLKIAVKNITDITTKMNNSESSFGQLISNDDLVRDAKTTLRKVDRAMDGFADSGPITALGVVASGLF